MKQQLRQRSAEKNAYARKGFFDDKMFTSGAGECYARQGEVAVQEMMPFVEVATFRESGLCIREMRFVRR
jgi:hypothetical protein